MMDLNDLVFGRIQVREILGADPDIKTIEGMLEQEMATLLKDLKSTTSGKLQSLITKQLETQKHINSRPGAMALPQNKIRLYTEYSLRYIKTIKAQINSKV